jgi:hypothetical protein
MYWYGVTLNFMLEHNNLFSMRLRVYYIFAPTCVLISNVGSNFYFSVRFNVSKQHDLILTFLEFNRVYKIFAYYFSDYLMLAGASRETGKSSMLSFADSEEYENLVPKGLLI